ncbi:uncharacterized protein EI90DRAFT_2930282 [Cantharellus anzutake]|uniref:uncharacterized protein n=1 Tax=Cantharellus anzutake TaxID=1750568 RepID=UPI001903E384|nr:uncharacterized protein EI90DRAFT_2930282 [Cantharellus anzutake]KAF8326387.1 hypothetical protein EI90DRAFT_2930282 [Cantharellus anzutake]
MTIYTSPLPRLTVPKRSVFTHLFGREDPFDPSSTALIDGLTSEVITRGQLRAQILTFTWGIRHELVNLGGRNLRRGETALVFSPNFLLFPVISLGLNAAGVIGAFANTAYTPPELAHQLVNSCASHVFVHPSLLPVVVATYDLLKVPLDEARKRTIVMSWKNEDVFKGWTSFGDIMTLAKGKQSAPEDFNGERANETAFLFYSSGTTGLSKGVECTHNGVNTVLEMCRAGFRHFFPERDVLLAVLPFFHVFGGVVISFAPLSIGVPLVILPRFQPQTFLSTIQTFRITGMYLAPPVLLFMNKHPMVSKYDLSSLRNILLGAAPVSTELILQTREKLRAMGAKHLEITQAFGLTETTATTHILPPERSVEKVGSIGILLPNQEARLVGEDGTDAAEGERGELWIRGDNIMKGYLYNPEATANSITPDGWFKTGDIATRDNEGFYKIVDRKKELIKYKGWQVPPAELEALLVSHPEIADSGVIGVHSEVEATEVPRAYVVPRDTSLLGSFNSAKAKAWASSIDKWVQTKVAQHKFLRGGVIVRDSIPRSQAGKILRKELRSIANAEDAKRKRKPVNRTDAARL